MNEWNPLEMRLRSWTPRRPSEKCKAGLFTKPALNPRVRRWSLGWLAPASVCGLLLFVTLNQRSGQLTRLAAASDQVPIIAVTLSNMSFAAYLPGSFAHDQNAVRPDSFEWTNQGRASVPSFPQSRTNGMKR